MSPASLIIGAATAQASASLLPFLLICLVCAALIGGAVFVVLVRRDEVSRRVGGFVAPTVTRADMQRSLVERALGDRRSSMPQLARLEKARLELEVAEVHLTAERLALVTLVATALVGWLLAQATHSPIAVVLSLLTPFGVFMFVRTRASRGRRKFTEQLPDNLTVIASAMRAGQTFVGALSSVVTDAPEPSKRELHRAVLDEALGVPLGEALGAVTTRMKSSDFQHVAIVATLQRETGGNTAEVVDLVAETIRDRIEIQRIVRALTAQGRLAGIVLAGLPIGLLLIISIVNPAYMHPLFHTTTGYMALGAGVTMSGLGSFLINKIVNIKI